MGREVGGGIGMGKTCEPKAFSFQCMTKFTTHTKKKIKKKKLSGKRTIFLTSGVNKLEDHVEKKFLQLYLISFEKLTQSESKT